MSKKLQEEISDKMYEIADDVYRMIFEMDQERISADELTVMIAEAYGDVFHKSMGNLSDEEYNDLETTIRGILSYRSCETDFENGDIIVLTENIDIEHAKKWASNMDKANEKGEFDIDHSSAEGAAYSNRKTEGKKLSPEDEEYFNDEIDKVARQEIEDKLNNDKKEPDEEIEKELDNIKESKKEEGIETRELVSFDEIDDMMINAEDYSDLYEAASYIENNSLRVDVEQLIGQCEDDGDEVDVAYSIVTSDLLDSYKDEENIAELKVMDKVTEGADTLDNSDEEDLATLLFTEAFDGCSIDRNGKANHYEFQTLEEIQDWYDESVTEELYNKAKRIVEKALNNVKFYSDSDSYNTYIELNDNHTLWEIEAPEDANDDGNFDMVYSDIVNKAVEDFKAETGTSLFLVGRMGRHACVEANLQNALRYNELQEVQEKLEKEVIKKANAYLRGEGLDESKKITESKGGYPEMLSFASSLASALKGKGFQVKVNGEDNYINVNPKRDGAEMGVTVYLGEEDGQFGFEENTVGLGGDTISDNTVYPIFEAGWDSETATPSGDAEANQEVYAMFKEISNVTPEEVVAIIEKSFDAQGPVTESKKVTESKELNQKEQEIYNKVKGTAKDEILISMIKQGMSVDEIDKELDDMYANFMMGESKKVTESKKDMYMEFTNYCTDLGIDPNKKSSINKFLGDYAKNYTSMNGIANFDAEMERVEKEIKAGLKK